MIRLRTTSLRRCTAPGAGLSPGATAAASVLLPVPDNPPTATRRGPAGSRNRDDVAQVEIAVAAADIPRLAAMQEERLDGVERPRRMCRQPRQPVHGKDLGALQ